MNTVEKPSKASAGVTARGGLKRHSGVASLAAAVMLVACGGGGTDDVVAESAAAQASGERARALSAPFPNVSIPSDAYLRGMWGPLYDWPLIAVHAVVLPDGRLLTYGSRNDGTQTANFQFDVWDNASTPGAGHTQYSNTSGTDIFCGSQLLLPPTSLTSVAKVFVGGGDNWTGSTTTNRGNNNSNIIDPAAGTITRGQNMGRQRWYATSTTLINGETLMSGGMGGADRAEVRATDGTFRMLNNADMTGKDFYYPRTFVLPTGKVFGYDSNGAMYFLGTDGAGTITNLGNFPIQYGSADASAAMFRPGRILQFGGNSNGALVIDVNSGTPVVTPTQSMAKPRRLATATILADGSVLASGGSTNWNDASTAHLSVELWNPVTGQWTTGPDAARHRLYHSNAIMLPDASVLVTGGGALNPNDPTLNQLNAQIYYPKYLFTAGGQRAARPVIASAPQWLDIGKTFTVQTSGAAVSRVVLIKSGSATHNWNMEQRFMDLAFTASGNTLSVQAPTKAGEATPGYYMLFVLDAAGVPSEAKILRMGVAATPNPDVVPTLANPGNRNGTMGVASSLQLSGSDPNGDVLGYSAAGLPPGMTVNGSTGLISGTPTTVGTYNVVAAVSDGVNSATASFTWTVASVNGLIITQEPAPSPSAVGSVVTFSADAVGTGVQYQWNFGDGQADTAWSTSNSATTNYSAPGTYIVTMRVRDSAGTVLSRSFLQTVFLPVTYYSPTASTPILVERTTTASRVWTVNPDNNSISAFDESTGAKYAEVTVGLSPRTLARSASGQLWVTNKDDSSISVVDPVAKTVVRTIALPRGGRPHGVAMSPLGTVAYVVLEATGQLKRFDTATYAQTGALTLGPNVRHVSVSADGLDVWVSRFITPPLPGEATAVVSTPATAGGEVLRVDAVSLTLASTVTLKHTDKLDSENQGRGIPNYLGAPVISPDASQAYVPGKLDNVKRGQLRDGLALNFQNTVRAASSRIVLTGATGATPYTEDLSRRVDHDNASMASAAVYNRLGTMLFVALETSREVAVVDAHTGTQWMRFDVGMAPQGLALSADGRTLYASNFMSRTITSHDLRPLLDQGLLSVPLLRTMSTVAAEKLPAQVLRGKQMFYDARDTRLSRDRYMSCASCHNDGAGDGRVWDMTHAGEGLRNTISLRGRAGAQGRLHWSANFDEVQDFEGQIRALAGGTGLMDDATFLAGTRSQPLGDPKAGLSADLDALAAYVSSLATFDPSPLRNADGTLTATATSGKALFQSQCLACHGTNAFTVSSATSNLENIGTLKPSSGMRLGGPLGGIDPPTLRDVWATAPYLHDGSALTLSAAISAHNGLSLTADQLVQLVEYTAQIGSDEPNPSPVATARYEAEGGTYGGGSQVQNATAASGGGVIGALNYLGSYSQVSVSAASAGPAQLVIHFANGYTTNRSLSLYVNGVKQGQVTFVPTGGWNIFADQPAVTVNLNAGSNTIRMQLDSGDVYAADIDYYAVTTSTAAQANRAPVVTAPAAQTSAVGSTVSLQVAASDADGDALTFSATGLPPGLGIGTVTGLIVGTPNTAGTYSVVVSVTDGRGGSASTSAFTWTVQSTNRAPTVNTPAAQTATVGTATSLQITASDLDGDTLSYSASGLPPGLFLSTTTGVIAGTPTTAGTYSVVVTVSDGKGGSVSTSAFSWTVQAATVANRAPTVSTPAAQTSVVSAAVSLQVAASDADGDTLSYSASGLPAGLSISASTGLISGAPTTAGTSSVVVTVSDGKGGSVSTAAFGWTVQAATGSTTVRYEAEGGTYGNGAALQSATGASNGKVIGALNNLGAYSQVSVNAATAGTGSLVIRFANGYTSNRSLSLYVNGVKQSQVTFVPTGGWNIFANQPAIAVSLKAGVNTIRLQRDSNDVYAADIDYYAVTTSSSGTVVNTPPTVTTPAAQSSTAGTAASLQIAASDADSDVLAYSAAGLPTGLSISSATGYISGTPTTAGAYSVVVTVTDGRGGSVSTSAFTWTVQTATVANRAPTVSTPAAQYSTVGVGVSVQVGASDADGDALTFSATGLPAGLGIGTTTGLIVGTPTTAGTYSVVVTVTDGKGGTVSTGAFSWTVQAAATSTTTRYESESGTYGGGAAVQNASAASSGKVIGAINNKGAYSQVSVNATTAGTGSLVIRFSNGYTSNRSLSLYVNGVRQQQVIFAPTGSWNTFASQAAINVTLKAGANTIRLQRDASDSAAADIDYYAVTR